MGEIDPGAAIVATVAVILVVMGCWALWRRRATRARMEALRAAARVEVAIVSQPRAAGLVLAAVAPIVFGTPFVAMALGEWGRQHALGFVIALLVVTMVAILVPLTFGERWTHVGRLVLDGDTLTIETPAARDAIALGGEWTLQEAFVPPGNHLETVVVVAQDRSRIVFRYPNFLADELLAPEGAVSPPVGVQVPAEARVVHEKLRARRSSRA